MFEAEFEKAELLKKILDAVKELVTDANLDCGDEGLKLQAMDNSHVALVSLHLEQDSFAKFRCDNDVTLGMNLTSLQKIIKCANNDDTCRLSAGGSDSDTLSIQFQGKRAARIGEYEMKLMDIDSEQLGIPETDYEAKISMPSNEFAKIMRDLKDLGESVRIEASPEGIKFTAEGEIGTGSVTVKPTGAYTSNGRESKKKQIKKEAGAKSKKVKTEDAMDEDDEEEDVKPKVKDESDEEEEEEDEEEDEDEDENEDESEAEEEAPKKSSKKSASKSSSKKPAAKKSKKGEDGEEAREVSVSVNQNVSLNFSIKYLNNFAKSTPLSSQVHLQMSNDVPLLVEYRWEGGSIKFYLAPKIAED